MNSLVCVDANIIVWALAPSPLSSLAEALLEQWQHDQVTLIAPALLAISKAAND